MLHVLGGGVMRVYVAGPVSGRDDLNRPAFERARRDLLRAGHAPLVPHDFVHGSTAWSWAMRRSLETMLKADGVACLGGWADSAGARLEVHVAQALGIPAMDVAAWLDPEACAGAARDARRSKACPRCRRVLPHLLFAREGSSPDGRQAWCADCMAGYKRGRAAS